MTDKTDIYAGIGEREKRSRQGKCCGNVGCQESPRLRCEECGCYFCQEHMPGHFHIEQDTELKIKIKGE